MNIAKIYRLCKISVIIDQIILQDKLVNWLFTEACKKVSFLVNKYILDYLFSTFY